MSFTLLRTARHLRRLLSYFKEIHFPSYLRNLTCFLDSFSISLLFSSRFFLAKCSAAALRNILCVSNVRSFSACSTVTHLKDECSLDSLTLPPWHSARNAFSAETVWPFMSLWWYMTSMGSLHTMWIFFRPVSSRTSRSAACL